MDTLHNFPFKIGQDAESKSHKDGYRGAWFRCKVRKISMRGGELWCALEYFDFPGEKVTWTKVYQKDPANRNKLELMMRPGFPHFCRECEITDCQNNAEIAAIINNEWQVGNLVDLWYDNCFWSGKVAAILDNGKIQVDLLKPPNGEGGSYEAVLKDLRPTLSWSIESGWIAPLEMGTEDFNQCVWLKGHCNSTFLMNTSGPQSHLTECIQLDGVTKSSKHIWNHEQLNLRVGKAKCSFSVTANSECFPNDISCQTWQLRGNEPHYDGPGATNQSFHKYEESIQKDAIENKRKAIILDNSLPDIAKLDRDQSIMHDSHSRRIGNSDAFSTFKKGQAKVTVDQEKSFSHVRGRLKQKEIVGGNNCSVSDNNEFNMPCKSSSKKLKRNSSSDTDEIESSIMVFEELANKVKWLKGIVQHGFEQQSDMTELAWKVAENEKSKDT